MNTRNKHHFMPASAMISESVKKDSSGLPHLGWGTLGILIISLALRWALVLRGGQYYFSDEGRYEASRETAGLLLQGRVGEGLARLIISPEHLGFKFIGILPAMVENLTVESLLIPGLFFSLFSVLNLYLIHLITRRAGASRTESLYALILASVSMSLLYYARHLMPYDPAMMFGLLAVYTAVGERTTINASLSCGALTFLCFITYNGYWTLAALAILLHVVRRGVQPAPLLRTGAAAIGGFIVPAILLIGFSLLAGTNLLTEYSVFSTTVSQGSYAEGWSLPFEYFWHTEHLVFIALTVLSISTLFRTDEERKSALVWIGAILFIYLCLLVLSVFLNSFVVYGRLARQMMPFLILPAASGLAGIEREFPSGRRLVRGILAVLVLQAAWNFSASLKLTYPREFAWEAQTKYPVIEFSEKRLAFGAPTLCRNNGFILEYVKRFAVPPEPNPQVQGQLLLSAPHPDTFLPYQYEGYTREERQVLRQLNPQMRLYKAGEMFMSDTNPVWASMKNCWIGEE
jgi:hypothetical protein